jgi:hypothetical protein
MKCGKENKPDREREAYEEEYGSLSMHWSRPVDASIARLYILDSHS